LNFKYSNKKITNKREQNYTNKHNQIITCVSAVEKADRPAR